jgi:hypothetical protein
METGGKSYIYYPSRSDVIEIWNLSDLHLMAKACAEDEILKDVEEIRTNPNAFWFGGGDYCDYISYTDRKRFDPDAVDVKVTVAELGKLGKVGMERTRDIFTPIKDKCLGLLFGNHEMQYMIIKEQKHLHSWLCTELGVQDLGYCAIFDVVFCRVPKIKKPYITKKPIGNGDAWTVRMAAHHGAGFATTPGGKLNRLIQFMNMFPYAQVVWCGHVHDQKGQRQVGIDADGPCNKIIARERLGVISGGYLKTYQSGVTTYGEMKGYGPTVLGAAKVSFTPDKQTFLGEI